MRLWCALAAAVLLAAPVAAGPDPAARGIAINAGKKADANATAIANNAPYGPWARRAQMLLRAAARAVQTGVLASDPMTIGTAGAASTITGATATFNGGTGVGGGSAATMQVSDVRVSQVSGKLVNDGNNGWASRVMVGLDGATRNPNFGTGVRFGFDGQVMDFGLSTNMTPNTGGYRKLRIRVTDLATGVRSWTSATDYSAVGSAIAFYKLDFGSRANRVVEIYVGPGAAFTCFNAGSTDSFFAAPPSMDQPRMAVFGDSWTFGIASGGYASTRGVMGYAAADTLGVDNPVISGAPSTGWAKASTSYDTWLARLQAGDLNSTYLGQLDLILIYGSINDNSATDAAVTANMTAGLTALRAQQPSALILVAGPQVVNAGQTAVARFAAMKAAVLALNDAGILWLDNSYTGGDQWTSGAGFSGVVSLTGNSTNGSTSLVVTANTGSAVLRPGMVVSGSGIPSGTKIASGSGLTGTFVLTQAATATASGVAITLAGPTGSGNGDIYIGTDGTHPANDTSETYYGKRAALSVLNAVALLAQGTK